MKEFKFGLLLIIIGFILVGALALISKEDERAIDSCIKAGHGRKYCEYHLG